LPLHRKDSQDITRWSCSAPLSQAVRLDAPDGRHSRWAHLSDPHLPPPAPRQGCAIWRGKNARSAISNWTRNRHKFHRRDVLETLVSDMRAQTPDHVAITGDPRQSRARSRIPRPALEMGWRASAHRDSRHRDPRQSRRLCFAPRNTASPKGLGEIYLDGDDAARGVTFPSLRRRGPAWR